MKTALQTFYRGLLITLVRLVLLVGLAALLVFCCRFLWRAFTP